MFQGVTDSSLRVTEMGEQTVLTAGRVGQHKATLLSTNLGQLPENGEIGERRQ